MRLPGGLGNVAAALSQTGYRRFVIANIVSLSGTWLQRIAVGWLAWELTHSAAWLGLMAMADLIPPLFLAPLTGALADRHDKLRLIRVTQSGGLVQAVLLALLAGFGWLDIWGLFFLTIGLGVLNATNQPARLALMPLLVDRAMLPAAIAINSITFNVARFIGPAIGGLVLANGGSTLAFALNAVTYVGFLAAIHGIRVVDPPAAGARPSVWRDSVAGIAYAARHPAIGPIFLLMALGGFGARGMLELLPGFADRVFASGADGFASLMAVLGLGAVMGGLFMMVRPGGVAGLSRLVIHGSGGLGLALAAFLASPTLTLGLIAIFVVGTMAVLSAISAQTLVQYAAAVATRGRTLALYGMILTAGPALGALAFGALSEQIGLRQAGAVGVTVALAGWFLALRRRDGIAGAETSAA
jgi:MFS family permease